jgi:hypothetical protein
MRSADFSGMVRCSHLHLSQFQWLTTSQGMQEISRGKIINVSVPQLLEFTKHVS